MFSKTPGSSGGPDLLWISDNYAGTSTLYNGSGGPVSIFPDPAGSRFDDFIFVSPPGFATAGTLAAPTGIVFKAIPRFSC